MGKKQVKNKKSDNCNLEDSFLYKKVMENLSSVAIILIDEEKGKKVKKNKKFYFYKDLFYLLREIDYKMVDLKVCVPFISVYPSNEPIRKIYNRSKYSVYHLEYYYINVVALYDRCLKLLNFLYDLGLDDKDIKLDLLLRNKKIDKKVNSFLKKFYNAINNIRILQNKIKHKHKLIEYNEDFNKAEKNDSLLELDAKVTKLTKSDERFLKKLSKDYYRKFIVRKKKELLDNNDKLLTFIYVFYELLAVQVKKRIKNFK